MIRTVRSRWSRATCVGTLACLTFMSACTNIPQRDSAQASGNVQDVPHRTEFSRPTSLGVVAIPALDAHLEATLHRLLAASKPSEDAPRTIHIEISASPRIGAWSTNNTIYVPWRLLSFVESDDELAALIAHEASHVLLKHTTLDAQASLFGSFSAFGPLLLVGTPLAAVAVMVGGQYGDRALASGWARDQELEADAHGVRMLAAAGIRPSAMLDLLDNLDSLAVHGPTRRPGPVAIQQKSGGRTEFAFHLGGLRFGRAEDSHPDLDARREQVRQLLQGPAPILAAPTDKGPVMEGWPQAIHRADVQAALQGLIAAHRALAAASGGVPLQTGETKASDARRALASPIGSSFVAYWAAASSLPEAELRAQGLPPIGERLRQPDTPIIAFLAVLADASKHNDWATAATVADLLRDRFQPDRGLYKVLSKVYANRAKQIAAQRAASGNKLSTSQTLALTGERMQRDLQSAKMFSLCLGTARDPNDMAGGCKD